MLFFIFFFFSFFPEHDLGCSQPFERGGGGGGRVDERLKLFPMIESGECELKQIRPPTARK